MFIKIKKKNDCIETLNQITLDFFYIHHYITYTILIINSTENFYSIDSARIAKNITRLHQVIHHNKKTINLL